MNQKRSRLLRAALVVALASAAAQPQATSATPVVRKLSGVMPSFGAATAHSLKISPNSLYAVYTADAATDSALELWSAPVDGSAAPVRLSGLLPAGESVTAFEITPDSQRVVYVAEQDTADVRELYSTPITASVPLKLNGPLVAGGDVGGGAGAITISPDSSRVVYTADQDIDGVSELYSVSVTGGAPVKLHPPLGAGRSAGCALISPDGTRVAFVSDFVVDDQFRVYSVPITGGAGVGLSGSMVTGGSTACSLMISPDSTRVVYYADQQTDEVYELYSVPSAGGAVTKLNGALVTGGDVQVPGITISPDSSRVIYSADQAADEVIELYSVPLVGGVATKLNGALIGGGNVAHATVAVSPDSSRVIYQADQQTDETFELYSAPIAGGPVVKLNGLLLAASPGAFSVAVSPDSSRVVYMANQDVATYTELYAVPLLGGPALKLNSPLSSFGYVGTVKITPDSSRVVFVADPSGSGTLELFAVPLAGGPVTKISGPLTAGGNVDVHFHLSPNSQSVVYVADQDTDGVNEVFATFDDGMHTVYLPLVLR